MSLHPQAFCAVPAETVCVARTAYPKGNVYLQIRDELGTIYTDQSFAELFPNCGQPAEAPWLMEKPRAHTRVSRFGRLAAVEQPAA